VIGDASGDRVDADGGERAVLHDDDRDAGRLADAV
jgi:hypothetical protein